MTENADVYVIYRATRQRLFSEDNQVGMADKSERIDIVVLLDHFLG